MTSLRGENHALRAELSAQQQQLADVTMVARSGGGPHSRHGPASSFLSNKKNEDDTFDVEAAVLTGVGPEPVAPCCRLNMLVLQVHRDVMRTPDDMHDAPDRSANAAAPTFAVCRPQCIGVSKKMLHNFAGGSRGFTPLAGIVRGARPPLNAPAAVATAHQLDRLAVTLNQRPAARALVLLYMIFLHLAFVVF